MSTEVIFLYKCTEDLYHMLSNCTLPSSQVSSVYCNWYFELCLPVCCVFCDLFHIMYCNLWNHRMYIPVYEVLPKISENLLVITWILTLSPNFHHHLRSSHLGLAYNNSSDFVFFGSTHWSLPALVCLVPVVILLVCLQWIRNSTLSTRVSY